MPRETIVTTQDKPQHGKKSFFNWLMKELKFLGTPVGPKEKHTENPFSNYSAILPFPQRKSVKTLHELVNDYEKYLDNGENDVALSTLRTIQSYAKYLADKKPSSSSFNAWKDIIL